MSTSPTRRRQRIAGIAALLALVIGIGGFVTAIRLDYLTVDILEQGAYVDVGTSWEPGSTTEPARANLIGGKTYLLVGGGWYTTTYVDLRIIVPTGQTVALSSAPASQVRGGNVMASFVAPQTGVYTITATTQQFSAACYVVPVSMLAAVRWRTATVVIGIIGTVAALVLLIVYSRLWRRAQDEVEWQQAAATDTHWLRLH